MKMQWIAETERTRLMYETETEQLEELLSEFKCFLSACGYAFDLGENIEVVDTREALPKIKG